jgi:hypothetical protein
MIETGAAEGVASFAGDCFVSEDCCCLLLPFSSPDLCCASGAGSELAKEPFF